MQKLEFPGAENEHEHLGRRHHKLDSFLLPQGQRKGVVRVAQHRKNMLKQCHAAAVQIGVSHHSSFESDMFHRA